MAIKEDASGELDNIFRMPAVLGPAPGPRNMPRSRAHLRFDGQTRMLSVTALSESRELERILPEHCSLREPLIEVQVHCQKNLGWLAGRGYNIIAVRIPVRFEGQKHFDATFTPVLWESMADPILTGREELGSPKLFATIADPLKVGNSWSASATWEGFRFFDMNITQLQTSAEPPPKAAANLLYKYFCKTGDWGDAEVACMTRAIPGAAPPPRVVEHEIGTGEFRFRPPRWEDMPTQYSFVVALTRIPLIEFVSARSLLIDGIPDLAAQETVA